MSDSARETYDSAKDNAASVTDRLKEKFNEGYDEGRTGGQA